MPTLRRFLSYGFFPEELPHPFGSVSYGHALTRKGGGPPPEFLPKKNGLFARSAFTAVHNLARVGQMRRILGIPNPVIYFNLADNVVSNWTTIESLITRSPFTVTGPVVPASRFAKAIVPQTSPADLPLVRSEKRSAGRYLLQTDIQRFYPSVYTHSLAWAVETKAIAKGSPTDMTLLGNRLDYWTRMSQDRQTRGIPIGPDTSRVLAEILLASIDLELAREIGPLRGFRAIDDYELVFPALSDAENALSTLHSILGRYELTLNESKTRILEMPVPHDELWPPRLRSFPISSVRSRQAGSLLDFFNITFETALTNPRSSVLRYAIARTSNIAIHDGSWSVYQNLLLQCATSEPGTLPYVTSELRKYADLGRPLAKDRIQESIDMLIARHTPLGHGSEVAWAIWLAIGLDVSLPTDATKLLAITDDPLVPLLALHARSKKLVGGLDTSAWNGLMTSEQLWKENWLLAYEANVKGWLPSAGRADHVLADPCFGFLKKNRVSFYNARAFPTAPTPWRKRTSPVAGAAISA